MRRLIGVPSVNGDFLHYLKKEKSVISNLDKGIKEKRDAFKYFGVWGELQHDDIKDISAKMIKLLSRQIDAEAALNNSLGEYRQKMKEIKAREQAISDQQSKVKTAGTKLQDALRKQKESDQLKFELNLHEEELKRLKAEHEGLKRRDIRDAFYLYFQAYADYGQKVCRILLKHLQLNAVTEFGKHLADQIPQGTLAVDQVLPPFSSGKVTEQIMKDFDAAFEGKTIVATPKQESATTAPRQPSPEAPRTSTSTPSGNIDAPSTRTRDIRPSSSLPDPILSTF
ncbi:hypothetical protein HDU67_003579 [Dinochytrium kinnereticum]|nr:hypothetical protein HDU67_003579 [Dinochytrium kinnereticum]